VVECTRIPSIHKKGISDFSFGPEILKLLLQDLTWDARFLFLVYTYVRVVDFFLIDLKRKKLKLYVFAPAFFPSQRPYELIKIHSFNRRLHNTGKNSSSMDPVSLTPTAQPREKILLFLFFFFCQHTANILCIQAAI